MQLPCSIEEHDNHFRLDHLRSESSEPFCNLQSRARTHATFGDRLV
jgi:hypothetical protein